MFSLSMGQLMISLLKVETPKTGSVVDPHAIGASHDKLAAAVLS